MIEGVNASISTASAVRAVAQQVSSAESLAANPSRIQKAAIGTAYSSKYVELAPDIKPIFVVRDTDTGESIRQFPTESQIRAYQRAQQSRDAAAAQSSNVRAARQSGSTEEAAQLVESSVEFKEVRKEIKKVDAPPPPLPGQTKTDIKVGGDTGGEAPAPAPVKTSFSTEV